MELGSLKAEYCHTPSGSKSGPYFKHQVWKDGANQSQRVPAEDAPALETAIDNRLQFESLAQAFIDITVEHTRQTRFPDSLKKALPCFLAQQAEISDLMARFSAQTPSGEAVQQLETLVRTAIFKPASHLVGFLLQQAAERIDRSYHPKPGEHFKGR